MDPRYALNNTDSMLSPSLVIFKDLVTANLRAMIDVAGGANRLRPHVKTHKMPAMIRLAESLGIRKHKCATIAEAEMVAAAGGTDIMIAYPIVGPNIARFARLVRGYPKATFRTVVDDADAASALSAGLPANETISTLIDLDIGMGRTGIDPGDAAFQLYEHLATLPNLRPDGLQAYDGQIAVTDLSERIEAARPGQEATLALRQRLIDAGHDVSIVVFGGTPTFPVHARLDIPGLELSPGTCSLHDYGYATRYPDLPFVPSALLLTRVISRPRPGRITLDLGYKAVASDPPVASRVVFPDLPDATVAFQSEEHLVLDTPHAEDYPPGTTFLAMPSHICPTCALHRQAYVIENGEVVERWDIVARDRMLNL
ncbi:D-TA family PLP-dependent enzyme [Isosphaeraceae bacterium EP7]